MTTAAEELNTRDEFSPFFVDTRSVRKKLSSSPRDWIPTKPGSPGLIAGLVLERGTYTGLNDKVSPTLTLLDGAGTEWGVIAFHGFLRQAVERKNPRVGDWVAIALLGTRPARKAGESDAYMYRLVVERNPQSPLDTAEPVADPESDDVTPDAATATGDNAIPF